MRSLNMMKMVKERLHIKCQRTKDQLLHYAVPDLVVQIVQELSTNDKLAYHATRLLKVLSVCPNNKVFDLL